MSKVIDVQCNVEFPTDALYLKHKKSEHTLYLKKATPIEAPPESTFPPGLPVDAMPSQEFIEQVQRIENPEITDDSTPSQHPSELPPAIPLTLGYIWTGEHEACRRQPSTLKLEVDGKFFSVAYCESCKVQLESREVASLG
jgi:hypothetical protein